MADSRRLASACEPLSLTIKPVFDKQKVFPTSSLPLPAERDMPTPMGIDLRQSTLSPFAILTSSEQQILELAFEGLPNKAIATRLESGLRTVERRKATALRKLGVETLVEAAQLRESRPVPSCELIVAAFRDYAVPVAIVTPDFRIAAPNGAYCRVLGYSEAELIGKTIADISHPDDRSLTVKAASDLFLGTVRDFRLTKRYRRRGGDYLMAELSAAAALTPEGTPLVGVGQLKPMSS